MTHVPTILLSGVANKNMVGYKTKKQGGLNKQSKFSMLGLGVPVSYTHLDVYKRQPLLIQIKYCTLFKPYIRM